MNFTRKILKNGLRVIMIPMQEAMSVTVFVMVDAGSKYEDKRVSGISHFLEHMCFKGTTRRPTALAVTKELDSIGAEYNAFTTQEYTCYYAKAHPKHFAKILDVISDIYVNPVFDEAEIAKEKGVVIEEINMYEDTPSDQISDVLEEVMYGDQPAGWPVIGTKETVRGISKEDLMEYRGAHYVAGATTVVVAGKFDAAEAVRDVSAAFRGMSAGKKKGRPKVRERQSEPMFKIKRKDAEQAHLGIGVRSFPASDKRVPALRVLNAVLGGGTSSRLWQKIREEMGAAYYVYPYPSLDTDTGYFGIFAGADGTRVPEVVEALLGEMRRLKREPVAEDELKKAKDYLLGRIYLKLESSDEIAVYYAVQEALGLPLMKPSGYAKAISAVTAEDVRAVAKDVFVDRKLNFALIGKYGDEMMLASLLKL